ncbi:MAG: type II secretion system protein [Actinobacteria bacterium]|nr:type II secretion system protein [Actinomycetota bacterium]
MRRPLAPVALRLSPEGGYTILELAVTMLLMSIVMLVFGTTLASVQRTAMKEDALGQTNDQARLALEEIDREMRSGNVLYDPGLENGTGAGALSSCSGCKPYYTMRVYTQTNADTRTNGDASGFVCVMWQIDSSQRLLKRTWPPDQPENASAWNIVATGIVNRVDGTPAFQMDPDPLKGSRTLNVTLEANNDITHYPTGTVTLQAAFTGRNTSYGYPVSVCQLAPS